VDERAAGSTSRLPAVSATATRTTGTCTASRLNGRGLTLLTPEDADHVVTMAPVGPLLRGHVLHASTHAPVTVLRRTDGRLVAPLEQADVSAAATGWAPPIPFTAPGAGRRDGPARRDVPAVELRPVAAVSHHQPHLPRPAGRQCGPTHVLREPPRQRAGAGGARLHRGADRCAGHAACGRSPFQAYYYGDLGDNGLEDQIAVMRQLAERTVDRPVPRRHLRPLGRRVRDGRRHAAPPRLLPRWRGQRRQHRQSRLHVLLGREVAGPAGPQRMARTATPTSPSSSGANLRGALLLAYGTMDNNVHPNMTLLLINELIRTNRTSTSS
jgi:dipeptidyl-peptidase 4